MLEKFYLHLHRRLWCLCSLPPSQEWRMGLSCWLNTSFQNQFDAVRKGRELIKSGDEMYARKEYLQCSVTSTHFLPRQPMALYSENHYIIRAVSNWLYSGHSFWPKIYGLDKNTPFQKHALIEAACYQAPCRRAVTFATPLSKRKMS